MTFTSHRGRAVRVKVIWPRGRDNSSEFFEREIPKTLEAKVGRFGCRLDRVRIADKVIDVNYR